MNSEGPLSDGFFKKNSNLKINVFVSFVPVCTPHILSFSILHTVFKVFPFGSVKISGPDTHIYYVSWRCNLHVLQTYAECEFYIHVSGHSNSVLIRSNKMQQFAVFIYCKITLHVSSVHRTHHQAYIKL